MKTERTDKYIWDKEELKTLLCAVAGIPEKNTTLIMQLDNRSFDGVVLIRRSND